MNNIPSLKACRDNILSEAMVNETTQDVLSSSFNKAQTGDLESMSLQEYLMPDRALKYRADKGIIRLGNLRTALGCIGVRKDGSCCLAECITLQEKSVDQTNLESTSYVSDEVSPAYHVRGADESVEIFTA